METDWRKYSEKIREMLDEHLEVTGLKSICKLRSLTDPAFWGDFKNPEDIKEAAVRKLSELKKETQDRADKDPARYEKFSDRIKELIKKFNAGLVEAQQLLDLAKEIAEEVAEDRAHQGTGLNERPGTRFGDGVRRRARGRAPAPPQPQPRVLADAREVSTGLDRAESDARAVGERAPGGSSAPP